MPRTTPRPRCETPPNQFALRRQLSEPMQHRSPNFATTSSILRHRNRKAPGARSLPGRRQQVPTAELDSPTFACLFPRMRALPAHQHVIRTETPARLRLRPLARENLTQSQQLSITKVSNHETRCNSSSVCPASPSASSSVIRELNSRISRDLRCHVDSSSCATLSNCDGYNGCNAAGQSLCILGSNRTDDLSDVAITRVS
jgi:hypothetical protein